jgi:hypothetical protein
MRHAHLKGDGLMMGLAYLLVLALIPGFARATDRISEIVNSFQVLCTLSAPNFKAILAQASAMKLPARALLETQSLGNYSIQTASWIVHLKSGTHELVGSAASGPDGDVDGCGIGAADVDGDDLRTNLDRLMKLGLPQTEKVSPDGLKRISSWNIGTENRDGANRGANMLILTDGTPSKKLGIYLTLLHRTAGSK